MTTNEGSATMLESRVQSLPYVPAHWSEQEIQDYANLCNSYTGVQWDRETHDYCVWHRGQIVGWSPTPGDAAVLLQTTRLRARRS
jgi:hypothetical protein